MNTAIYRTAYILALIFVSNLAIVALANTFGQVRAPENLALKATCSSDSYHPAHPPSKANDGIARLNYSWADYATVWLAAEYPKMPVDLVLEWGERIEVGEIVYYAPTSHDPGRCWKDYQVFVDDVAEPVASGQFVMRHGGHRIVLEKPVKCGKVRMRFTSHYGAMHPGAAEIKVFSRSLTNDEFTRLKEGIYYDIRRSEESKKLKETVLTGKLGFDRFITVERKNIWPSHVYTYHQEDHGPGGGIYAGRIKDGEVELTKILDSSKGMVLDHPSNNVNPCWLPDGGVVFLSDRKPAFAYCWVTTSPILYRCEIEGSNVVRLSANYLNDFTPSVMMDGRIIYSRWEYVDRPAIPMQSLWTMNQDGTGLAGLFGNRVLTPATFMEARQIPGSNKVLCIMTAHNGPCRGAVGVIDPSLGSNSQEAINNITPGVPVDPINVGNGNTIRGPYATPVPIDDKYYLVTRSESVLIRDYALTAEVTLLKGVQRQFGYDNPAPRRELGFYDTQPLKQRSVPAMRAQVLDENAGDWASIVLRDVYNGLEPDVKRGQIKKIAVVQEMEKSLRGWLSGSSFLSFPAARRMLRNACGGLRKSKKTEALISRYRLGNQFTLWLWTSMGGHYSGCGRLLT